MKDGFRKELVIAAVAIPLALVATGCSSPQEQESNASSPGSTVAQAPATPAPVTDSVAAPADSATSEPQASSASASSQPAASSAGGGRTIADGVYTRAQAARGEYTFQNICSTCHTLDTFSGPHFSQNWGSRTVGDMHQFVSENMPMDAPGSLTAQEYADVIAYFISQNGFPAGQTELPTSTQALKQIKFAPSASSD